MRNWVGLGMTGQVRDQVWDSMVGCVANRVCQEVEIGLRRAPGVRRICDQVNDQVEERMSDWVRWAR